ncbi:hypothetical protein QQF64_028217 [Cirrhinus molitorella]|uniref:Uncharacterized protein n=1 Tax=Cirrhinus molitorella TaxID=172907 RepID=A0ABR3N5Y9_9TELE
MNSTTWIVDSYEEALAKNIVIVSLGLIINFINGMLVVTFFSNPINQTPNSAERKWLRLILTRGYILDSCT